MSGKAKIVLEDGRVFNGYSFAAPGTRVAEMVFNTGLTGYQEVLTDPSYRGQMVVMTYPLIGNYGINDHDAQSRGIFLEAFIVKECSRIASNWCSVKTLSLYLKENNVIGVEGVDTRAITKHIRLQGAAKAVISTEDLDEKSLLKKLKAAPGLVGRDLVKEVSIDKPYVAGDQEKYRVVLIDCGAKTEIIRCLTARGCKVTVVPYHLPAKEILKFKPDGIMLSNGPGDPAAVAHVVDTIKDFLGKLPLFGICLGHQMLGQALGGKTFKLKFGHHGCNHPVKDLKTGSVVITSQNHGFCVDIDSLNKNDVEITHINLNDNTLEGLRHKKFPAFSVQFHPEAAAGPRDAEYLFDEFVGMMKK